METLTDPLRIIQQLKRHKDPKHLKIFFKKINVDILCMYVGSVESIYRKF